MRDDQMPNSGGHFADGGGYRKGSDRIQPQGAAGSANPFDTAEFTRMYDAGSKTSHANHTRGYQRIAQSPRTSEWRSDQPFGSQGLPPRHRHRGRTIAAIIGVLLLALVVVEGISGFLVFKDAKSIAANSQTLIEQAKGITVLAKNKDADGIRKTAGSLTRQVADMKSKTDGAPWLLVSFVPVIGQDVSSARTLVSEMDNLCKNALEPGCDVIADTVSKDLLKDGAIDLSVMKSLTDMISKVTPVVKKSSNEINGLPESHIGKLNSAILKVKALLNGATDALSQAKDVVPHLTNMLGAGGQSRTYLIVAQNNAELRSTGGFPGSIGTLAVDNGKISLGNFTEAHDMKWYDQAGFGTTEQEWTIFGDRVGRIPGDTNFIPDFSRSSSLLSQMWTDQKGGSIDGVIAIDPILLQKMLGLVGGFAAASGQVVDGSNAAAALMHDSYLNVPLEYKTLYFGSVAKQSFEKIMGGLGQVSKIDLATTMAEAIKQRHFHVWMANKDEQAAMVKMGCSGTLSKDRAAPSLGVFVADDTSSKMSWYLSLNTAVGSGTEHADGTTTYKVSTTIKNNLSRTEASKLVPYITGGNSAKRDVTDMIDKVYLFAPAGGTISNMKFDGYMPAGTNLAEGSYEGFQVFYTTIQTLGGATTSFTYDVTVPKGATKQLVVNHTPTAQEVAGWK